MRVAIDIETHLIKAGQLFPQMVCLSSFDGKSKKLFNAKDGLQEFIRLIRDPDIHLVLHNGAFDLGVLAAEAADLGLDILPQIFQAYADDRISDTMIRSMLVDIAQGKFQEIDGQKRGKNYGLDRLALRWLKLVVNKLDTWRLHYAALEFVPLAQWPQDARDYAEKDAEITWLIDQEISRWAIGEGLPSPGNIPDQFRQIRAAWVLHLMAGWGVRIDSSMVDIVRANLEHQVQASYSVMEQYDLFKKDKAGNYKLTKKGMRSKNLKKLKELILEGFTAQGETPPMTAGRVDRKTGQRIPDIQTSADAARDSGHVACMAYADVANAVKLLGTYVPALERGANNKPVTSSPNVLVASGRTSWTGPNWQNPPVLGNIRECVIPREGKVLVSADLDTVELRALAQTCLEIFGFSEMANALLRGEDLHTSLAAEFMGISYAQAQALQTAGDPYVAGERDTAKRVNFGLGGGMGAKKFALTCIVNGSPLIKDPNAPFSDHVDRAQKLKEIWFKRWPEMKLYLQNASNNTGDFGSCTVESPWSGRIRGGLQYCSYANTYFQGRVADGAKLALWRLAWACYVDKTNILYGSRLVLFLHDEVILECPESIAHLCADEINKILCGAVQEVIPSIPITSKPVITRRWYKSAKPVKVNGILVPCKPEKDSAGKTKWIHDPASSLLS